MNLKEVAVFKTLRHMETVRNYLNTVIKELLTRGERHDQSKLQSPEIEIFAEYTCKLRGLTYGSPEYAETLSKIKPATDHHFLHNSHHPEYFENGIQGMTLIDLVEMICDWQAATLRQADGDLFKSLDINQKRFGYSDELKKIFINTAHWLENQPTFHRGEES